MTSPDILLFAIRGALRLGNQARVAYVDSTRNRELTLPLPNFNRDPSPAAAANYFLGRDVSKEPAQLQELVRKVKQRSALTPEEENLLLLYHEDEVLKSVESTRSTPAGSDGSAVTGAALSALASIRQWQRGGEPNPSALQRLAGTFVEIAVDYFVSAPGGLDPNSRAGRALRAFFSGFDDISFSTEPLSDLPSRMFSATMETIAANPNLLAHDPKVQELITAATRELAADVAKRIAKLRETAGANPDREARIRGWGELAFRSLLSSVGKRLADEPGRFLGVSGEANAALVSSVAHVAIGVVLDQPEGDLEKAFSQPALERIADAALTVVSRYPELVAGGDDRLRRLVSESAADLAAKNRLFDKRVVPDIVHLLLARTADNLPLLWPDPAGDPKKHLGLTAARTMLEVLARKPGGGERWKPTFTSRDLSTMADAVLDELVENPGWLVSRAGDVSGSLATALEAMVSALRKRGDARLSTELAVELLKAGLHSAALRSEFLMKLQDGALAIGAILDSVLAEVLDRGVDPKVQWRLVKNEVIVGLFVTASRELAKTRLDAAKVAVVQQILKETVDAVGKSDPWDLERFASDLEAALAT